MTRERPLSILMLGLLNLLVGGLCLFAAMAKIGRSLVQFALGPGQRENMRQVSFGGVPQAPIPIPDLDTYLDLEIPALAAWEIGEMFVLLVAGIMLLALAYGLLHMRPWVRPLAMVYALGMFAWQVAYLPFQIIHVLPIAEIYYLDESWRTYSYMPSSLGLARQSFLFFAWGQAALMIGHAALVLFVLSWPTVRSAFRGQSDSSDPVPPILSARTAQASPGSI